MHPDGGPLPDSEHPRLRVAIAGASGFVGRALRKKLAARFEVIGLTRRPSSSATTEPDSDGVEWRQCDLFDPESIEKAIAWADVVIYLVHSMSPQSRLTQARFDDLDLLLADNMRRAMDVAGTRHVVFLGGLGADQDPSILSRHLVSRQEVGAVLGGGNARLTELRAGLEDAERARDKAIADGGHTKNGGGEGRGDVCAGRAVARRVPGRVVACAGGAVRLAAVRATVRQRVRITLRVRSDTMWVLITPREARAVAWTWHGGEGRPPHCRRRVAAGARRWARGWCERACSLHPVRFFRALSLVFL